MQAPVFKNRINLLRRNLLGDYQSSRLRGLKGAFVDLNHHIDKVVEVYGRNEMFDDDSEVYIWKVSWDNRGLAGKNEAWTLSPMSVPLSQSMTHAHDIMIAAINEKNIDMNLAVSNAEFLDVLEEFENSTIIYNHEEKYQKLILCADWNALHIRA